MKEKDVFFMQERKPLSFRKFLFTKLGIAFSVIVVLTFMFGSVFATLVVGVGLAVFIYRNLTPLTDKLSDNMLNNYYINKAKKEREQNKVNGWRIKRKQKLIAIGLMFFVLSSVNVLADTVVYVYSTYTSEDILKNVVENEKILEKKLPKNSKFLVIKENDDGMFELIDKKNNKILGMYDDMLFSLIKAYNYIPKNDKVWLFFAGHSEDKNIFFISKNKEYTIEDLYSFLSINAFPVYFLGLDVCGAGTVENERYLASSGEVRYIAGSDNDEMSYGFQGIYEHMNSLISDRENVSADVIDYYMRFTNKIITEKPNVFVKSGFTCVSLNVYDAKTNIFNRGLACFDKQEGERK